MCLFSYGQTGSGKTHTMTGSGTGMMRGIVPRAVEHILARVGELQVCMIVADGRASLVYVMCILRCCCCRWHCSLLPPLLLRIIQIKWEWRGVIFAGNVASFLPLATHST